MVSHRSHKPSVSGSTPDPATKKIWNIKKYFLSLLKYREIVAAVARKAHNLEVGGSIPPLATTGEDCGGTPRFINPKDGVLILDIRALRVMLL